MEPVISIRDALSEFLRELLKRKLVTGVLFFLLALILTEKNLYIICLILFILLLVILLYCIRCHFKAYIIEAVSFSLAFFVFGFLLMSVFFSSGADISLGDTINAKGVITEAESFDNSFRYTVKIGKAYLKCFIYTDKDVSLDIGDYVRFSGEAEAFDVSRNDGEFNSYSYYRNLNIKFFVKPETIEVLSRDNKPLLAFLRSVRDILSKTIDGHMDNENGVLKAIILGEKSDLDDKDKYIYQKSGISHILAISGLHVSNFSMLLWLVLDKLRLPKKFIRVIIIPIVILYGIFSGFSASVMRAVIMYIVADLSLLKANNYDIPTALALAFFIYSLFYPLAFKMPGTVLSYLAVVSIWLFSRYYKKVHVLKYNTIIAGFLDRVIAKTIFMGLFLTMFSLPMVLYYFNTLPVFAVLINIYVVPVMTVLFLLAVSGLSVSFVSGIIAEKIFKLCTLIITSFTKLSEFSVNVLKGVLVTGKPKIWEILTYYLVLFIILLLFNKVKRRYLLMLMIILPTFFLLYKPLYNSVTMLDVDQGDCFVVTCADDKVYMIDCGSLGKEDIFRYTVEPYLLSNGIKNIDYLFLSHSDMDHINGIIEYLNSENLVIEISNIVITPQMSKDENIRSEIIDKALSENINIFTISEGMSIKDGHALINCLHPKATENFVDVNDSSMVLEFDIDKYKLLFTGDISSDIEKKLKLSSVDILKLSHHGSATASGEDFLNKTSPKVALISCGRDNSYGHPSTEVTDRIDAKGIKKYITAHNGQIRIHLNKKGIMISKFLPSY